MCNCLNETLAKLKEKIEGQIKDSADLSTLSADYEGRVLRFDGKANDVMLRVGYKYYKVKSGGERYKNVTQSTISLSMAYCPVCGVKYE